MTNENSSSTESGRADERQLIRVCAPSAHAGIGDALRRAFAPPPVTNSDRELLSLLERF
ncbi:MAG: hypothetical protein AVDCRST_MAG91-485 [uncultured Sphingomonadaceae bacterium]|uniref:Uncharacterized protein n=1 Tax=uncultured Sphingomonadaceae bacterium TaxID=169976 RepID=A0A6J4S5E8_9SPHN|nr:MAG: hypothetical protein AVDCRST_MAG91-485 [uncultured Sphingomonadaceae bacterium]